MTTVSVDSLLGSDVRSLPNSTMPASIVVVNAIAGCGASVVAAALADMAATRCDTTLVDLAPAYLSGLHATAPLATRHESSVDCVHYVSGWREDGAYLLRMDSDLPAMRDNFWPRQAVPARSEWLTHCHPVTVVDFSWRVVETVLAPVQLGEWLSTASAVVLTMPATSRGVDAAEHVAAALDSFGSPTPFVVVTRERKAPQLVAGGAGAYLSRVIDAHGILAVPEVPSVRTHGATAPLPAQLTKPVSNLLLSALPAVTHQPKGAQR